MITPRRDQFATDILGLAVANEDGTEHVQVHLTQFAQGQDSDFLAFAADVADDAGWRIGRLMAQDDVAGLFQIIGPLLAGRVVQADDEITSSGSVEAIGDFFPWRQQVAEGNKARIGD